MKFEDEIFFMLGEEENSSISFPIFQTSNFKFASVAQFKKAIDDEENHLIYSRGNNPTLDVLALKLAALDGKDKALLFSSGMGAISTAIISQLREGDKILCMEGVYSWTAHLCKVILPRFGVKTTFVRGDQLLEAIEPGYRLVYIESPLTKTFELVDVEAVTKKAHEVGAVVIMDNSYASPLRQKPGNFGVDIIVYSASKYTGGHSDTVAGYLTCDQHVYSQLFRNEYLTFGAIMAPLQAWLVLRGLRTLRVRLNVIEQTTWKIIRFLENHPAVERVLYPGSASGEQKRLFEKQMQGITGLFSVQFIRKDPTLIQAFCERLKHFRLAVSWGGYESLVLPYTLWETTKNEGMVRLSIGLEDASTLIEDLSRALEVFLT